MEIKAHAPSIPPRPKPGQSIQVGGNHYANKAIQPIDYIMANSLPFCEASVVKYITRHKEKGGAEDIRKIKQYCDFILKYEYGE